MRRNVELAIQGMHCANCANTINKALAGKPGIDNAEVNFGSETARVAYDSDKTSLAEIESVIRAAGYEISDQKSTISVGKMHCASCATRVKAALTILDGVIDANVNSATESVQVTLNPQLVSAADLKTALEKAGYEFRGIVEETGEDEIEKHRVREQRGRIWRMAIGFGVSVPLMALMYLPHFFTPFLSYIMLAATTPVFLFVSWPIFVAAFSALKNRSLTMDVMYGMGISVAYAASVLGTFGIILGHEFMLYDTAIMLASFLTLGRFLEARARGRTSESIKKLIGLQPRTATIITEAGEKEVAVESVVAGDVVLVKPGDRIPVDGTVVSGSSSVDEAMITGESIPVVKKPGGSVIGGTFNRTGVLRFTATRVGKETVLAQIIKLVREAQGSRPPIQRIADKAVSWFIPVVLAIALVTFAVWFFVAGSTLHFALTTLIAVLVIACPCALGLASPTAVTVGIGRGAELGILIKNGEALEIAERLTTIIFDKTGTLTRGEPVVTDIVAFEGTSDDLLAAAAAIERNSRHPLGDAIVKMAADRKLELPDVSDFDTVEGRGVSARVGAKNLLIGNRALMSERKIVVALAENDLRRLETEGKTAVMIAADGILTGILAIADTVKETAARAVRELREMSLEVVMMSGDNRATAQAIAYQIGIEDVLAEVLPQDKAAGVKGLQHQGKVVAFVGDGINDAPALAQADVGIAVGSGTDIAIESGEIVLVKSDPVDVVAAIQLGRKLLSKIRWNLFWAFAYNTALIPLAAGVLYPFFGVTFKPELAGLAMALSSVTVVTLSLMLRSYVPPVKR